MLRSLRRAGSAALAVLSLSATSAAGELEIDGVPTAERVLERAFRNRYDVDTREFIEVVVRNLSTRRARPTR